MNFNRKPALVIEGLAFYETPPEVEGAPYWVDLWAAVNGYMIGLQIKPRTYHSSSLAIYTGKARNFHNSGHKKFQDEYGGSVIVATIDGGMINIQAIETLKKEIIRLRQLPPGPFSNIIWRYNS